MSRVDGGPDTGAAPAPQSDAEIVARIAEAIEGPFDEAWRRYESDVWHPIRDTLRGAAAAHERALAELGGADPAEGAARYDETVSAEVLAPLGEALRRATPATTLRDALSEAAEAARARAADLPARADVPLTSLALARRPGFRGRLDAKRLCARALRPLVWRRERHDVRVATLARRYLERITRPRHAAAFEDNQRRAAAWLGRLERAWTRWAAVVLTPPPEPAAVGEEVLPDGPQPRGASGVLAGGGRALQRELAALVDDFTHAGRGAADIAAAAGDAVLRATVAADGTFVARDPARRARRRDGPAAAESWDARVDEVAARLDLYRILMRARLDAEAVGRDLTADWLRVARQINAALSEIETALRDGRRRVRRLARDPKRARAALDDEQRTTAAALEGPVGVLRDPAPFRTALSSSTKRATARLQAVGADMPEAVRVHRVPGAGRVVVRPGEGGHLAQVSEAAAQAFDSFRLARLRKAPNVIAEALTKVRGEVRELSEVSEYGYDVSRAELSDGIDEAPEVRRALAPATEGLGRADDKLRGVRAMVFRAVAAAEATASAEISEGVGWLVQRTLADRLAAGLLRARSYLGGEVAHDWRRRRRRIARGRRSVVAAARRTRARAVSLARTLGLRPPVKDAGDRGVPEWVSVSDTLRDLPPVYRRLFSFEPLTDVRRLAGREQALADIAAFWREWEVGGPGSLFVVSPASAGVTTFLNLAATRLSASAPGGVRRTLRERERDEARFAGRLAAWLGLEAPSDADGAGSLSSLAEEVLRAPEGAIPPWVILEGAELLHLRVPGGCRLFESFVTFITRTQPRVLWIISLNAAAWQFIRLRSPGVVSGIRRLTLDPLGPDDLRDAIFARHRRSGIPLRFAEPPARGAARLLQRLHARHPTEKRRKMVEAQYFRRLHRASLGSVRLALVHWLRSADLDSVEGHLVVRPLTAPTPSLDRLTADQSFALKALLNHGTLTSAEYGEIMRARPAAALHMFRALAELRLIEAVRETEDGDGGLTRRDAPHRIRPLVLGIVCEHLRSRNILH